MYSLSDKSQFQALAIHLGKHQLAPVHLEILDWITKQFGARALDFYCETRVGSKGFPQQLIHVILETVEDVKKMQANRADSTVISERFLMYLKSANPDNPISDPLKSNVFPPNSYQGETNPFPEIILTYRPLKALKGEILKEMREDEKRAILETFESVWTMSQYVVFYYTDAQKKENMTNGTSTRIIKQLEQADQKYEFHQSTGYCFDSKESFDRDYSSNWYYYWK